MIMKSLICLFLSTLFNFSFLFAQFGPPKVVKLQYDGFVSKSQVIDIDNDGFKDIVASTVSSELIIHLNKGNLFKTNNRQRIVPANISTSSYFDFKDLDSDNLPELVAMYQSSSNQSGFLLFKNLGDGNFDHPDTLAIQVNETGSYIIGMKLFDINNDGFSDIIYASSHTIKIFSGTSDPHSFSTGNTVYTNSILWIDKFDIKDMNNDGSFDIVFNSNENDLSHSYLDILKHSGNSYTQINLMTSEFSQEFGNVRYEDINNDNQIDIVLQDDTRSLISGTNAGNLNFTYATTPFQSNAAISFELSDINGDNYPEVVLANGKTFTYFPNNQGVFSNSIPSIGFIFDYIKLHCTDFNNDGRNDFLFQNSDLQLTLNTGNSFGYTSMIMKTLIDSEVSCLDFDHNGTEDLIFTDGWISNEGGGKFGAMNFFNSSPEYIDISDVGDIDQDGDYDVVGTINDSLFSFINQGNSYDFIRNPITTSNFFRAIELSDLNNDGHLDLSYAVQENGIKLAFRLNQSGSWGNEQLISFFNESIPSEFKFQFSDFNGDSKPDFIIPTYNYLRIFVNNGTSFDETIHYVTGDQYLHPNYNYSFLDFNLDGHTDIVMHTYNTDYAYYLSVLINDGNMNFTGQHLTNPYEFGTLAYQFSDLNSDNDLDLFISDGYSNLSYYENHYNSFDMSSGEDIYLIGPGVHRLASGKLFGNENPEIIVSKEGMVLVYENLSIPHIQQPTTGTPFPNPATNLITFGIPFNQFQSYTIEVFSNYGTLELSGTIDYENTYLDIASLSSGIHLAKITNTQTGEVTNISFIKI